VVFTRPFVLARCDGEQPAGRYVVETSEELQDVVSFPVWRRHSTTIRLHPRPGLTQTVPIDPADLDAALVDDGAPADIRVESRLRRAHRADMKAFLDTARSEGIFRSGAE
jgi:hypothetical protein